MLNGFLVAAFALAAGALVLRVDLPVRTWSGLALAIAVSSLSCTGLGLLVAAVALRVRQTQVLSNIIVGLLVVFAGVNVPVGAMPAWMRIVAHGLPLTNGIGAARRLAAGYGVGEAAGPLLAELGLGVGYAVLGLLLLRLLEVESRRRSTLESV